MARPKFPVSIGQKFNSLTILKELNPVNHNRFMLCRCDCGNEKAISLNNLRNGTKSCGCFKKRKMTLENTTHGESRTKLYSVWCNMKERCYIEKCKSYINYGARGIRVHESWRNDFETFREWALKNGYTEGMTIERHDVNGDYCPENCSWIPKSEQSKNRRSNHFVEYKGETKTLSEWSRLYNINRRTLHDRLESGWSTEESLLTPPNGKREKGNKNELCKNE